MRPLLFSIALLLLVPDASSAIALRWSSGSTAIDFISATRCTLITESEPQEEPLPDVRRLVWVGENCNIRPVVSDPGGACATNLVQVTSILEPTSAAEVAAHQVTAELCRPATGAASAVMHVFDLPAGSRGKFKVIALDPTDPDSMRVIESNVVTFNGGIADAFPPVILHTRTHHLSTEFQLTAVGAGLTGVEAVALAAQDGSWRASLLPSQVDDRQISATGAFAASVPACFVEAEGAGGLAAASVEADPPPPPLEPEAGCQQQFIEDIYPPYTIQAKDFAFIPGGWTPQGNWTFHLFYIRQNQLINSTNHELTTKNLGHAVSNDLDQWTVLDTAAVAVRPGRFDSQHVWAPSIVKRGLTYHMFYTGLDDDENQRIGIATSTDLVNWDQGDSVLSAGQITWADPAPLALYGGASQLRDPFVMEDPIQPGGWLMYFVTVPADYSPGMVVGVAKSSGNFSNWTDAAPLWATLRPYIPGVSSRAESPHAFFREGKWWLFHTVNSASDDTVYAVSNATGPADTVTANWSPRKGLQFLVPLSEAGAYNRWHASEYLEISATQDIRYLAAFNDLTTGISYTQMRPTSSPYLFTGDCPTAVDVGETPEPFRSPRLSLLGVRPARSEARFRIELPARSPVSFAIYDVRGRRVRSLVDGDLPAGATDLVWDGRDQNGATAAAGVYFGSLQTSGARFAARVPFLR